MKFKHTIPVIFSTLALVSLNATAASCLPFLQSATSNGTASFTMSTMNKNGVASFSTQALFYRPSEGNGVRVFPAELYTSPYAPAPQYFSDRVAGYVQPFNYYQADAISLSFTIAASPQVNIVLESWGNGQITFTGTCEGDGVIRGSTSDTDFLIHVSIGPPIQ